MTRICLMLCLCCASIIAAEPGIRTITESQMIDALVLMADMPDTADMREHMRTQSPAGLLDPVVIQVGDDTYRSALSQELVASMRIFEELQVSVPTIVAFGHNRMVAGEAMTLVELLMAVRVARIAMAEVAAQLSAPGKSDQ